MASKIAMDHLNTSYRFIEQAQEEFEKGDILQASEKAWGAAARAVKAAAEQRGWEHYSHRHLFESVAKIASETSDGEFRMLFSAANTLHQNFYEGSQNEEFVQDNIQHVLVLVNKLTKFVFES